MKAACSVAVVGAHHLRYLQTRVFLLEMPAVRLVFRWRASHLRRPSEGAVIPLFLAPRAFLASQAFSRHRHSSLQGQSMAVLCRLLPFFVVSLIPTHRAVHRHQLL